MINATVVREQTLSGLHMGSTMNSA